MNSTHRLLVSALVTLASSCASVPMQSAEADLAAKQFNTTPGKANLYIYRNEMLGSAIKMSVLLDGAWLGDTAPRTFLLAPVAPGRHTLTSQAENDSILEIDAAADTNQFVWQEVKWGVLIARSRLQAVDEKMGQAGVAECKLAVTSVPVGAPGQPSDSAVAGSAKPAATDQAKVAGAQQPPSSSGPKAAPATMLAAEFKASVGGAACALVHAAGNWSVCEIPGQSMYVWSSTPGSPAARFSTSGRDWRLYHEGKVWTIKLPDCVTTSTVNCNGVDRAPFNSPWDLAVSGQVTPTPALEQEKSRTLGDVKLEGSQERIRISLSDGELIDFLAGASRISVRPGDNPHFRVSIWRGDTLP